MTGGDEEFDSEDLEWFAVVEMGMRASEFWDMTWYEWILELYKYHRNQYKEEEQKYLAGYIMAQIGNFAGKMLPKNTTLGPEHFFKFRYIEHETVPDEVDLQELMSRPELKYRFKKKDG